MEYLTLKLQPSMNDDRCTIDSNFLNIPVSFVYECKEVFKYVVSDGLQIVGKINPDLHAIQYFIGNNCSIEQLASFIMSFSKKEPCQLTLNESEDVLNMISYDPTMSTWTHKSDSVINHIGGIQTFKMTDESHRQFVNTLESYRKFAFTMIEGHKRLCEANMVSPTF